MLGFWPSLINQPWLARLFVLSVALLILKITHNILLQAGGLDPFFYTSYIQNYSDLLNRYGPTYYSSRVAHLYPSGLITRLFGAEPGYLVYRFLLLSTALGVAWSLSRKLYPAPVAFFVTILTACHPWLLRSLFWEHYDSSGVVYLLLATGLLGGAGPTERWKLFLAGGAYALAAVCNAFLLAIGFALFASYFFVHIRWRVKEWILPGVVSLTGFLTFYVFLCILVNLQLPAHLFVFDLFSVKLAGSILTGMGKQWHVNVVELVQHGSAHLLVPAVVSLATWILILVRRGKQRPVVLHASLNLTLVIVIYIVVDFVQKAAVIGLFYYFIYLFPATLFCLIVLIGEVAETVGYGLPEAYPRHRRSSVFGWIPALFEVGSRAGGGKFSLVGSTGGSGRGRSCYFNPPRQGEPGGADSCRHGEPSAVLQNAVGHLCRDSHD